MCEILSYYLKMTITMTKTHVTKDKTYILFAYSATCALIYFVYLCDIIYSCHVLKHNAVLFIYLFILVYKVAKFECMKKKGK